MEERSAEYQAEYDKAAKELEEADQRPRGPDGKFVKAEPAAAEPAATLPAEAPAPAPAPAEPVPDPMAEMRAEIARLGKVAEDNKAWGTRTAQALADLKRERQEQERIAARPKILDANPELEAAVRYLVPDGREDRREDARYTSWKATVESVHPGILGNEVDPELLKALEGRKTALGDEQWGDPMVVIREVTAEKLAHANRQADRRIAAEVAKLTQKSAMSIPGPGATATTRTGSSDQDAVDRIRNMSDAEFERERRRTLGY